MSKKQENQINNLYRRIKELSLEQDDIDEINIKGFLYSVGRFSQLQITAFLTAKALSKGLKLSEIMELLANEYTAY